MRAREEEHIVGGGKIRSVILGLNDGLISTFTLLVGIAAATLARGNSIVILAGIAAMVSGAISMGLGEYVSSKSEYNYIKNEIKKEAAEIELFPEEEKLEVKEIFENMGLKGDNLNACVDTITSNKERWLNFLLRSELGIEEPENPILGAFLTFLSFICVRVRTFTNSYFGVSCNKFISPFAIKPVPITLILLISSLFHKN